MLIVFLVILILLLINALYVAAEFGTVSARRSRLVQLAEDGSRLARMVLPFVEDTRRLDTYAATCQLGITVSSLILGYYAQANLTGRVAPWLTRLGGMAPVAATSLAATIILLVLTFFQVIIGELVPKNVGVQYPERLALLTIIPLRWSIALFKPLIWLLRGSTHLVLRLAGIKPSTGHVHVHSPEEIAILVEESRSGGLLEAEEQRLIESTLTLHKSIVRQVMVPRTRVLAAPIDRPYAELLALLADSTFSRLPLYEGSIDNIVGVVHLKDLLCLSQQPGEHDVREVMSPAFFVLETMPADEALTLLQQKRHHVAIVLDEYGGTAGIVALEDLIEEIFGELQDEFDREPPFLRVLPGNRVIIRWDWLVEDLNEALGLQLPSEQVETIGGLVLSELGHVPQVGDLVQFGDLAVRVEQVDGKAVAAVSMTVTPEQLMKLQEAAR